VQLKFGAVGNETRITAVNLGARPTGVIWGAEGAHMSAWALLAEGLKTAVLGKTYTDATVAVRALYAAAKALPVMGRRNALPRNSAYLLDAAERRADAAEAALAGHLDPEQGIPALQELVAAYLQFRNTVPLSAAEVGGPHDTRGESNMLATLRTAEPNPGAADPTELRDAMWGLLDAPALADVGEITDREYAPGILLSSPEEQLRRIALIVRTHVQSVRQTFPRCYAHVDLAGNASLSWFLGEQQVVLIQAAAQAQQPRGSKRRRDEPEDADLPLAERENRLHLDALDIAFVRTYVQTGAFPPMAAPVQAEPAGERRSSRPRKKPRPRPGESGMVSGADYERRIDEDVAY
jgi:hypothetical protein